MNCELCNDKIVIVPPPTVCFSCASTLQNLRETIDSLRTDLHKINIENGGIKSACATLRGDNDRLRAEFAQAEKDYIELTGAYENASVEAERLRAENADLRKQLMNNSPGTASDGGE